MLKDSRVIYPLNYSQAILFASDKGTMKFIEGSSCALEHGGSTWTGLFLVLIMF